MTIFFAVIWWNICTFICYCRQLWSLFEKSSYKNYCIRHALSQQGIAKVLHVIPCVYHIYIVKACYMLVAIGLVWLFFFSKSLIKTSLRWYYFCVSITKQPTLLSHINILEKVNICEFCLRSGNTIIWQTYYAFIGVCFMFIIIIVHALIIISY